MVYATTSLAYPKDYVFALMLWLKSLVLDRKSILYRVYIRELDRELCTRLFTLYTNI